MCLVRFSSSGPSPPHSATEGIHVFTQPLLNIGLLYQQIPLCLSSPCPLSFALHPKLFLTAPIRIQVNSLSQPPTGKVHTGNAGNESFCFTRWLTLSYSEYPLPCG